MRTIYHYQFLFEKYTISTWEVKIVYACLCFMKDFLFYLRWSIFEINEGIGLLVYVVITGDIKRKKEK